MVYSRAKKFATTVLPDILERSAVSTSSMYAYQGVSCIARQERHPGLVYWRVRPTWIRYSDLNINPPIIQEWDSAAITGWPK